MKYIITISFVALIATSLRAQLLTVTETSARTPIVLDLGKQAIVDINGVLKVEVDSQKLAAKIGRRTNPELSRRIKTLNGLLKNEKQLLSKLTPAIAGAPLDIQKLNDYSALMGEFLDSVMVSPELTARVDVLYDEAAVNRNKIEYPTLDTYVIKNLAKDMDNLVNELRSSPQLAAATIQVVAFLSTKVESDRRVHVENFDNFAAGNFFEVPRWVTSFSEDDIKSFNEMASLSNQLNKQIESNFSDIKKATPKLGSVQCFNHLVQQINRKSSALAANGSAEVNKFLSESEKKINAVVSSMQNILLQKENTGLNALEGFNQAQAEFLALTNTLASDVLTLRDNIKQEARKEVDTIYTEFESCVKVLKQDADAIKKIYDVVNGMLSPFKHTASTAAAVAGEAFAFTLDKLPGFGRIDLKTTGRRENGSEIVIKVISRTKDDIAANMPGQTIDVATINLQQINLYSESNIGVIIASPKERNANVLLPGKVQFAPSGSLLLKVGSRKYMWWNNLNPGIGFNISTPDFNIDGAPDISYGGAITLFKNVLTGGIAYNTKTSSPFWFVGLSLPFASLGLPLGNVETQKIK